MFYQKLSICLICFLLVTVTCKNSTDVNDSNQKTIYPLNLQLETTHVSSVGLSDGVIDLTVTGGTAPYQFSWSNGATTEDIINIPAGEYSVEVIDAQNTISSKSTTVEQYVTDIDGNLNKAVKIGNQFWLAENLRVTHDSGGNPIDNYVYNNDTSNVSIYGRLYTWNAAMNGSITPGAQGIAPDGWHIPTVAEWQELITYLGGVNVAGGKMKEAGLDHWIAPNEGATNSSGFNALPAGELENGRYQFISTTAIFWTSNQVGGTRAQYYFLSHDNTVITPMTWNKDLAYSVRCIKD